MLAGVCGGLAQFLGLDPSLVRIAYAILTVFTAFAGVIIYILMWIIVPEEKNIDF
jgi:phage shock protein PspC (stress-responsive transcriptional regulator)